MIRKLFWPLLASVVAAGVTASLALGSDGDRDNERFAYAIGLWGDLPYSDLQATTGVPNLIADMNASDLAFSVHDGDLKAGNGTPGSTTPTTCSDALYVQGLKYFDALDKPALISRFWVRVPGGSLPISTKPPKGGFFHLLSHPEPVDLLETS